MPWWKRTGGAVLLSAGVLGAPAFDVAGQSALDRSPDGAEARERELGTITVIGRLPTSLPTQIPTTIEGITGADISVTINAIDAEDALKYFPSLNVRERYIGDDRGEREFSGEHRQVAAARAGVAR
jgi:hypothetical protein